MSSIHLHLLLSRLNGPRANNCSFKHMPFSSRPIVEGPCCTLFFSHHPIHTLSSWELLLDSVNAFGKTVRSQVYAREGEGMFQPLGFCVGASGSGKPFRNVWAALNLWVRMKAPFTIISFQALLRECQSKLSPRDNLLQPFIPFYTRGQPSP